MQVRIALVLAVIATLTTSKVYALDWIEGLGGRSCSFIAENADRPGFRYYLYEWIAGFVTAYNTYAPYTGPTFFQTRAWGRGNRIVGRHDNPSLQSA